MRRRALSLLAEGLDAVLHQQPAAFFPAARGGVAGTSSSSGSSGCSGGRSTAAASMTVLRSSASSLLSNCRALSSLTQHEASIRSPEWNQRARSDARMASTTTAASAEEAAEASKTPPPTPSAATPAAAASPTPTSSPSSSSSSSPPYFEVIGRLHGKADFPQQQQQQQDPSLSSSPAAAVFAVVDFGGTQHKACRGDLLYADGWLGGRVDINDVVRFTRVLAVGSAGGTRIGRPALPGVSVTAAVEELVLDAKQLHFTKRRRKASRRLRGHRQPLTALRVLEVEGAGV